jgi:hypothetical protein
VTRRPWLAALTTSLALGVPAACSPATCPAPPASLPAGRASAAISAPAIAAVGAVMSASPSAAGSASAGLLSPERERLQARLDDPKVVQFPPELGDMDASCGGGYEVSQETRDGAAMRPNVAVKKGSKLVAKFSTTSFASVYAVACGAITGAGKVELVVMLRDHANRDQSVSLLLYRLDAGITFVTRLDALIAAGIRRKPAGGYWFVTRGPELDEAPFRAGEIFGMSRLGTFPRVYDLVDERFVEVSASVPEFYRKDREEAFQPEPGEEPCDLHTDCGVLRAMHDGAYSAFIGDWSSRRGAYGKEGRAVGDAMAAGFKAWVLRRKVR